MALLIKPAAKEVVVLQCSVPVVSLPPSDGTVILWLGVPLLQVAVHLIRMAIFLVRWEGSLSPPDGSHPCHGKARLVLMVSYDQETPQQRQGDGSQPIASV